MTTTLEEIFTADFGIPASPLQLAICRIADGRDLEGVLTDEQLEAHFGTCEIGSVRPRTVVVIAGIRSAKSLLSCASAVSGALSADLSALRPGEIARHIVVAPNAINADLTFKLLVQGVRSSPALSSLVIGETSDTLTIQRLDGRVVDIVVVAASRGGLTLRSSWLTGATIEEVALFGAEASGAVVNAEEIQRAAETRLVPGGQCWIISSPFGPTGILWELYKAHFGKPGRVLVVHAPTRAMNPSFPESQIEELRAEDPDTAAREYDATWLDAATAFVSSDALTACIRKEPIVSPPVPGWKYLAAIDPASRGNAFTLVVSAPVLRASDGLVKHRIALAHQWVGSKKQPLDLDQVFREMQSIVRPYGVTTVMSDQYSFDANSVIALTHGLSLREVTTTGPSRREMYENLQVLISNEQLELPPVPMLKADLSAIQKKATQGGISIVLPKTPNGRHCDFAPPLALVVTAGFVNSQAKLAGEAKARRVLRFGAAHGYIKRDPAEELLRARDALYQPTNQNRDEKLNMETVRKMTTWHNPTLKETKLVFLVGQPTDEEPEQRFAEYVIPPGESLEIPSIFDNAIHRRPSQPGEPVMCGMGLRLVRDGQDYTVLIDNLPSDDANRIRQFMGVATAVLPNEKKRVKLSVNRATR